MKKLGLLLLAGFVFCLPFSVSASSVPATGGLRLNLQEYYTPGTAIAISATNTTTQPMTVDEVGQCHRFFRLFDRNGEMISLADPLALCTMEFRSKTIAPQQTVVLDTLLTKSPLYCVLDASTACPPGGVQLQGVYRIEVQLSAPTMLAVSKVITIEPQPFRDVASTYWAYSFISSLFHDNIIQGYGNGTFGPENAVTKAEMVKIALNSARQSGLYPNLPSCLSIECRTTTWPMLTYRDVAQTHALSGYITWAAELGIIATGSSFSPDRPATRFECLQILFNAFQRQAAVNDASLSPSNSFEDVSSPTMRAYTDAANSAGVISGIDGRFYPEQSVRRSEVAKMAYNLMHQVIY